VIRFSIAFRIFVVSATVCGETLMVNFGRFGAGLINALVARAARKSRRNGLRYLGRGQHGPAFIEYLCVIPGDGGLVKDQDMVRVDIQSLHRKIGCAGEYSRGNTVPGDDESLLSFVVFIRRFEKPAPLSACSQFRAGCRVSSRLSHA
jgi:hypothetical protein